MQVKTLVGTIILLFSFLTIFIVQINPSKTAFSKYIQEVSPWNINLNNSNVQETNNFKKSAIIKKWEMPDELLEISGLCYIGADKIACIQDEVGTIFIYDLASSRVVNKFTFEKKGDFEDIAVVGNVAWVIRSDGHLFEIKDYTKQDAKAIEYSTSVTSKENAEGLCYDKKNNRLLVSVKDRDLHGKNIKGIYAFDPESKKFNDQPVYEIKMDDKIFGSHKLKNSIRPSAITIDPISGDIYVLDGPSSRLLILGSDSKGKKIVDFNKNEFRQAEGITFSPEGKMYISNEGLKNTPGNILEVSMN